MRMSFLLPFLLFKVVEVGPLLIHYCLVSNPGGCVDLGFSE